LKNNNEKEEQKDADACENQKNQMDKNSNEFSFENSKQ
jgi:hypothetical protein